MSEAADKATEVVAEVAEEVADQATYIAEASRALSSRELGIAFGGLVVGIGLGGVLGYIFCQRKLETKYQEIAEAEIDDMREHFRARAIAAQEKPPLDDLAQKHQDIVETEGYSDRPPMAITPPEAVVEAVREAQEDDEVVEEPEEPAEPEVRNVFGNGNAPDVWDINAELRNRSPVRPYVIHVDEQDALQGQDAYEQATLTYYSGDDVLCRDNDDVVSENDRDMLVGESNLGKFGHGSGDANIVYVRNDRLEIVFEIICSPNSYQEEVAGFQHSDGHRRRQRVAFDDD